MHIPAGIPAHPHGAADDVSVAASWCFQWNLLHFPAGAVPVSCVRPDETGYEPPAAQNDEFAAAVRAAAAGSAGLPVGVQIAGPPHSDETVLWAMKQLELALAARPGGGARGHAPEESVLAAAAAAVLMPG